MTQHWPISDFHSSGLNDWLRDGHMTQVSPIRVCPWTLSESSMNKPFLSFKVAEPSWSDAGLQLLVVVVRGACQKGKPAEMNNSLKDGERGKEGWSS